nr:hypothetical protein [Photorhabdus stackebrandtii]
MNIIAIDLGTTNIKVSVYDKSLTPLNTLSETVNYNRNGELVEFDYEQRGGLQNVMFHSD